MQTLMQMRFLRAGRFGLYSALILFAIILAAVALLNVSAVAMHTGHFIPGSRDAFAVMVINVGIALAICGNAGGNRLCSQDARALVVRQHVLTGIRDGIRLWPRNSAPGRISLAHVTQYRGREFLASTPGS
jgi:hypothetical protein